MKLSEYRNEDALDLLADIIDPVSCILIDKELKRMISNDSKINIVSYVLKTHKTSIVEILARLSGVDVKDYNANIIQMTNELLDLLNDKELMDFFASQGQIMGNASSGSATEITEETEAE